MSGGDVPACGRERDGGGRLPVRSRVEALLFCSRDPVSVGRMAHILDEHVDSVKAALEELADFYERSGSALCLQEHGGGKWSLELRPEYSAVARDVLPAVVTDAVLVTLALIASRPDGVLQSELVRERGKNCYSHVRKLIEEGLVTAVRRGNTRLLRTTARFRRMFRLLEGEVPGAASRIEIRGPVRSGA